MIVFIQPHEFGVFGEVLNSAELRVVIFVTKKPANMRVPKAALLRGV